MTITIEVTVEGNQYSQSWDKWTNFRRARLNRPNDESKYLILIACKMEIERITESCPAVRSHLTYYEHQQVTLGNEINTDTTGTQSKYDVHTTHTGNHMAT